VLLSNTFDPVLTFVETTTFTGQIVDLVSDDDYAAFQTQLSIVPDKGSLLVGCGGVRKIRMAARGKGKSGGARVLYLYLPNRHLITSSIFSPKEMPEISPPKAKKPSGKLPNKSKWSTADEKRNPV
jgi:hypothetical protein